MHNFIIYIIGSMKFNYSKITAYTGKARWYHTRKHTQSVIRRYAYRYTTVISDISILLYLFGSDRRLRY